MRHFCGRFRYENYEISRPSMWRSHWAVQKTSTNHNNPLLRWFQDPGGHVSCYIAFCFVAAVRVRLCVATCWFWLIINRRVLWFTLRYQSVWQNRWTFFVFAVLWDNRLVALQCFSVYGEVNNVISKLVSLPRRVPSVSFDSSTSMWSGSFSMKFIGPTEQIIEVSVKLSRNMDFFSWLPRIFMGTFRKSLFLKE